jgi:hypothetical protein
MSVINNASIMAYELSYEDLVKNPDFMECYYLDKLIIPPSGDILRYQDLSPQTIDNMVNVTLVSEGEHCILILHNSYYCFSY